MHLRLDRNLNSQAALLVRSTLEELPIRSSGALTITFETRLSNYRGRLLTGTVQQGIPVYAATFIGERRVVLESGLLRKPGKLRLILIHEIFHFVWARLGNSRRRGFGEIIGVEHSRGAKGELGESASLMKEGLQTLGMFDPESRLWREYVCESFCDTAAWMYARVAKHPEFALAKRWQRARRNWFASVFSTPRSF